MTRKLTLKLCCGHTKLTRKLLRALAELARSQHSGLRQLFRRQCLLTRRLESTLTKLPCTKHSGLRQLLDRQPCLRRQLLCGQAQLALLLRRLRGQLLRGQAQLARRLRRRKPRLRALCPKGPGKLRRLLRPSLLSFKCRLRPLRRRLKARRPHLRRGPSLLLQNVPAQLLFGHRLARPAKRTRTDSLRRNTLPCNLALPCDVRKRLLHRSVFELAHKALGRSRVKRRRRPGQARNALLRRRRAKSACLLQRLRRLRGNSPRALNCCGLLGRRLLGSRLTACSRGRRHSPRSAHNVANATQRLLVGTNAACRRLLSRGPRSFCTGTDSCCGARGTQTCSKARGARRFCGAKTCLPQSPRSEARGASCARNCACCSEPRGLCRASCFKARGGRGLLSLKCGRG